MCVQCDDLEPLSSFAPSEMRNHVNTLGPLHGMLSWVPRAEGFGFQGASTAGGAARSAFASLSLKPICRRRTTRNVHPRRLEIAASGVLQSCVCACVRVYV